MNSLFMFMIGIAVGIVFGITIAVEIMLYKLSKIDKSMDASTIPNYLYETKKTTYYCPLDTPPPTKKHTQEETKK